MSIIHLPDLVRFRRMPLIAFLDLQEEFLASGRARSIRGALSRLDALRCLLQTARSQGLPIAHFRRIEDGYYFNEASQFSGWIKGFNPRPSEFNYTHSTPSCFSNESFRRMLEGVAQPTIVLAGFSGEESCLSTAIDAYHRGYRAIFLEDCSATSQLDGLDSDQSHNAVCSIISRYARVTDRRKFYEEIGGCSQPVAAIEGVGG